MSDYDRGRNYISVAESFLPAGYTTRNCGVGGDTLQRIWLRLKGEDDRIAFLLESGYRPVEDSGFDLTTNEKNNENL